MDPRKADIQHKKMKCNPKRENEDNGVFTGLRRGCLAQKDSQGVADINEENGKTCEFSGRRRGISAVR